MSGVESGELEGVGNEMLYVPEFSQALGAALSDSFGIKPESTPDYPAKLQALTDAVLGNLEFVGLVGASEILEVSRQRVKQLLEATPDTRMPTPITTIQGGSEKQAPALWLVEQVERYKRERGMRLGGAAIRTTQQKD